jgi:hypothetical protein
MANHRFLRLMLVFLVLSNSGCGVLTKSQVKEVNKFATAAKDYGTMPGAVIDEHAKIRKNRQLLSAAFTFNGDRALKEIQNALKQKKNLDKRGQEGMALV